MRKFISSLLFVFVLVGMARVCEAGLVIDEMMVWPTVNDGNSSSGVVSGEWFEVFNSGPKAVDLSTIKYDVQAATGANGRLLSGILNPGQYAIVTALTKAAWVGLYNTLPTAALFVQLPDAKPTYWKAILDAGTTLSLYDTVTKKDIFQLTYPDLTGVTGAQGHSVHYTGTDPAMASTFSTVKKGVLTGGWQLSPSSPGGTSKDFHSGGASNTKAGLTFTVSTAPEPATYLLMAIAGLGLVTVIRRQRSSNVAPV